VSRAEIDARARQQERPCLPELHAGAIGEIQQAALRARLDRNQAAARRSGRGSTGTRRQRGASQRPPASLPGSRRVLASPYSDGRQRGRKAVRLTGRPLLFCAILAIRYWTSCGKVSVSF
jgi:hypothetical protein